MKVNLLTTPIPINSMESWWGKIYIQSKQKMQERNWLPHENVTILAHTPKQHTISLQIFLLSSKNSIIDYNSMRSLTPDPSSLWERQDSAIEGGGECNTPVLTPLH